jgi:hypothetical protein
MRGHAQKFSSQAPQRGNVWCEPLKLCFPKIYRIVRKETASSSATPRFESKRASFASEFTLRNLKDETNCITKTTPVRHLSPSDDQSLIIRHHWSISLASAYLQGIEDMGSSYACDGLFATKRAIFTMTICETRKSWPGPTIFYLAERFEDDEEFGVQIWERSIGIDGKLRKTDIFYGDD